MDKTTVTILIVGGLGIAGILLWQYMETERQRQIAMASAATATGGGGATIGTRVGAIFSSAGSLVGSIIDVADSGDEVTALSGP